MSIVADFSVPADAFCLGEALAAVPTATAELDRVVAHSPDHVMPFVWITNTDRGTFDEAVAGDSTVESAEVTDSFEDSHLYQFDWGDVVGERLHAILDHDGVVLEARGTDDEWRLRVRFGSREHFSEFRGHFERFGDVTLHTIQTSPTPGGVAYGVSPKQREALLAAYDAGYYDTPSATTGAELARELGITQQSVSRRLRRGINALIGNTLGRNRERGT
jgi:hypothetical protein